MPLVLEGEAAVQAKVETKTGDDHLCVPSPSGG
jgi:hypothetical protein